MTEEERLAQEQAEQKLAEEKLEQDKLDKAKLDGEDGTDSGADSSKADDLDNQKIPYSRFQEQVAKANRLAEENAELKKAQDDARTEELKEQEKFKELYEEALETIKGIKTQGVASKIENDLRDAGYKEEQITRLSKLVEGETEDEIAKSIEDLKIAFPTKSYVDPSPDQRKRRTPEGVDGDDIGQSIFDRLRKSGKLKGFK